MVSVWRGGVHQPGVPIDEVDDLGHGHEPVRIVAAVCEAGQLGLPVRGEQAQGVPALRPPCVGHIPALEDHVVDRAPGEEVANRQAGVPGPDYDGVSTQCAVSFLS